MALPPLKIAWVWWSTRCTAASTAHVRHLAKDLQFTADVRVAVSQFIVQRAQRSHFLFTHVSPLNHHVSSIGGGFLDPRFFNPSSLGQPFDHDAANVV